MVGKSYKYGTGLSRQAGLTLCLCVRACNVWSWVPVVAPHVGGVLGAWIYIAAIGAHLRQREQPVDVDSKQHEREALSGGVD